MEMGTNRVLNHVWIIILHKYYDQIKRIKIKIPNICNEDNWLKKINTQAKLPLYTYHEFCCTECPLIGWNLKTPNLLNKYQQRSKT